MNSQAINNRVLAAAFAPCLGVWLESRGYKLTEDQLLELVGAIPVAYHIVAGIWASCCNAFMMYFPPKVPQKPVEPAKVQP